MFIGFAEVEMKSFYFFAVYYVTLWSKEHMTCGVGAPQPKSTFSKFDTYRSCGRGDITLLICHVTSRDHVIKRTCDIVGGSPHPKTPPYQATCLQVLWKWRYNIFISSRDTTWQHEEADMWRVSPQPKSPT